MGGVGILNHQRQIELGSLIRIKIMRLKCSGIKRAERARVIRNITDQFRRFFLKNPVQSVHIRQIRRELCG